jgi:hypothetical protein
MNRSGLQRIIPILLVIVVIGLAIWALVSVGRMFFSGSSSTSEPQTTQQVNAGKQALTNTTADRSVRMTVRGPIVADENFHGYSITISPDARNMTTYVGYMGQQVDTEQLANNIPAYEQFVYALERANFMEGTPLSGNANDTRGICATGSLYEFEVLQGSNSIQKLWTSTCEGSQGSLKASLSQITNLFRQQIPSFSQLISKINV